MTQPMTEAEFREWLEQEGRESPVAKAFLDLLLSGRVSESQAGMMMAQHLHAENRGLMDRLTHIAMHAPPAPLIILNEADILGGERK